MTKTLSILALMVFISCSLSYAALEDFNANMSQDDFAMLLVQELEMERLLPASAVVTDFFDLLSEMGIEPEDGWDIDGVITGDDLAHILGLSEDEAAGMSFGELVAMLLDRAADVLWARTGTRPAVSPLF